VVTQTPMTQMRIMRRRDTVGERVAISETSTPARDTAKAPLSRASEAWNASR